jgi:PhnB protein
VSILLYVEDCDAVFNRAVEAGGKVERPLANQFYGDRTGGVKDPFGFSWYIATHVEDVSPEEMERRAKAAQPA